jgi:methionine-rich copper-binding protein CopC
MVLAMLMAGPALAHARLDRSEPKVGSSVDGSPAEVKIWFTDDVDLSGTTVEVLDASGNQVDKKDLHVDPKDNSIVAVSLPPHLPPGKYKVVWHALCPQHHKTKGDFSFEVK